MSSLISVVIPIYHVEEYLNKCIDSVINQTYKKLEIILVDDGSPDNCGRICDEYAEKDKRIIVIHKENGGLSDARNAGIDIATGELIFFLDSDDYISGNCLEKLMDNLAEFDSDCAVTSIMTVNESGKFIRIYCDNKTSGVMSNKEGISSAFYFDKLVISVCGKLFKLNLFNSVRFPKGKIHEDVAVIYKLLYKCDRISYIAGADYFYLKRKNGGSITSSFDSKKVSDMIEIQNEMLFYIGQNIKECYQAAVFYIVRIQLGLCLRISVKNSEIRNNFIHLKQNVRKYRKSVISDKKADVKVKLCCLLSYTGFGLARLLWRIYRLTAGV